MMSSFALFAVALCVAQPQPKPLEHGAKVALQTGGKFLQDPVLDRNWPAGNLGATAGVHFLEKVDAKVKTLRHGDVVLIRAQRTPKGSESYDYAFCSARGYLYYDKKQTDPKQQWVILKVHARSSSKDAVIRDGDTVELRNAFHDTSYLHVEGEKWVACSKGKKAGWKVTLK